MTKSRLRYAVLGVVLLAACGPEGGGDGLDAGATGDGGLGATLPVPPGCVEDGINAPSRLECTGLYASLAEKRLNAGIREFSPASWLWSDGAGKTRWIWLPPGTQIDTSDPAEWKFPVGTKLWKEFRHGDQRVETRLIHKVDPTLWLRATYAWRPGELEAVRSDGGDIVLPDGTPYHLPDAVECRRCHEGRKDNVLGFEGPLLGLPGASGVTLEMLANEGRLSHPLPPTYTVPDDGTGLAAQALPWLHVNCGISCHNPNSRAEGANKTGLVLRIEPDELGGMPSSEWKMLKALKTPAHLPQFAGWQRLVPGAPGDSLMFQLAMNRESNQRMPPIASRIIDEKNMAMVQDWIIRLGAQANDAGASDAGPVPDAAVEVDAGPVDAGVPVPDAEVTDTGLPDAEQPDAGPAVDVDAYVPPVEVDAYVPPPEPEVDANVTPPPPEPPPEGPPPEETPPEETPPEETPPEETPPEETPPEETPPEETPPEETPPEETPPEETPPEEQPEDPATEDPGAGEQDPGAVVPPEVTPV